MSKGEIDPMAVSRIESWTHLILVMGHNPEEPHRMYWGQVVKKMVGEVPSPDKFRMLIYAKSRPEIRLKTELLWSPRAPENMPMPLSPEEAPVWQAYGKARHNPRLSGPGMWSLDVKYFPNPSRLYRLGRPELPPHR